MNCGKGCERSEWRCDTSNLAVAEEVLALGRDQDREILDVQRFGDRLDLLAPRPDAARVLSKSICRAAGLQIARDPAR